MHKLSTLVVAGSVLVTGCGSTAGSRAACFDDIAVGEVQQFGLPTPETTEGLTFDADGTLYVSANNDDGDDQLLAFMPDGTFEPVATSESILGLASHPTGIIAAAIRTGELLLIDPDNGEAAVIAEDLGAPNFAVVTPWDTILVSDDSFTRETIFEVTFGGAVSDWLVGVPTPNGMVFSADARTLYVAATFEGVGLWRVPVSASGEAGTPEKWVDFGEASTPDGVAIDSAGNVYVALNLDNEIAQVSPEGTVTTIARNVSSVASFEFGKGEYDPCSLYATSLFGIQLFRVGVGIPGS